jgi:two-component system, chemotaxis family, chemotaxis protein CheY
MTENSKLRVLVVDDDDDVRALFCAILETSDFELAGEASSGEDGVALFKETRPDLVLLDVRMPVMNGVTALKEILKVDAKAAVVMLTNVAGSSVADDCILAGAIDYIRKDRGMEALKSRLSAVAAGLSH